MRGRPRRRAACPSCVHPARTGSAAPAPSAWAPPRTPPLQAPAADAPAVQPMSPVSAAPATLFLAAHAISPPSEQTSSSKRGSNPLLNGRVHAEHDAPHRCRVSWPAEKIRWKRAERGGADSCMRAGRLNFEIRRRGQPSASVTSGAKRLGVRAGLGWSAVCSG